MISRFLDTEFILETTSSILTTLDPPTLSNTVSLTFAENNVGVRISGFTDGSGTVTLQGSTNETLTFPANGELATINTFTSLSTILTAGLTNETTVGKIEVFLSTPAGTPIEFRVEEGTYKGRISGRRRTFKDLPQGFEIETPLVLFTTYNVPMKIKDYVRTVGRTFAIEAITYPADLIGNINHLEAELREIS